MILEVAIKENTEYGINQKQVYLKSVNSQDIILGKSDFIHSSVDDAIAFFQWIVTSLEEIKEGEK